MITGAQKFKGQTLIEVVVALGVVVALALSLVTTTLVTQKSSRSAKNNTQATKLVQQSIEQMRVLRDRKGFSYLNTVPPKNSCLVLTSTNPDPQSWSLDGCPGLGEIIPLDQTNFTRRIELATGTVIDKNLKVQVTVTWLESGGSQTVSNTTLLSGCVVKNC